MADITPVLDDVAAIGPFFAIRTEPAGCGDGGWRPFLVLHTDAELWRRRIARVSEQLATDEPRVAASMAFLALSARLVAAPVAVAALHGTVPVFPAGELRWRPDEPGPWALWSTVPVRGRRAGRPDEAAALIVEHVVEPLLMPLMATIQRVCRVATGLLWGNVVSSLAGAANVLSTARPQAAATAQAIVRAAVRTGPLAGRGRFEPSGMFRRSSCCLYYRTPDGGLCADCPFDTPPGP